MTQGLAEWKKNDSGWLAQNGYITQSNPSIHFSGTLVLIKRHIPTYGQLRVLNEPDVCFLDCGSNPT